MIVYVETNFVLELVLRQEQHASCEELLALAQGQSLELAFPGFSLLEPYHTLRRRERSRVRLKEELTGEIGQLRRTDDYRARLAEAEHIASILIEVGARHWSRLEEIRRALLDVATVLPLDEACLRQASSLEARHDLSAEDACVLASVRNHLDASAPSEACFLNRNFKDFDDPDIVEDLKRRNCRLIPSFSDGLKYVQNRVTRKGD